MYNLEEVFKLSGLPTITFVQPVRYNEILISLRTPGRGVIIEGPSGIGKTMCVKHILQNLNIEKECYYLTPRNPDDLEMIEQFYTWERDKLGTIIIDDFHMVSKDLQNKIGNLIKVLADEENTRSKLILIGINSTGKSLVSNISDLLTRVSIFTMESNPVHKIRELIEKGEDALKVSILEKETIIEQSCGSFYICQDICHRLCAFAGILCSQNEKKIISTEYIEIANIITNDLSKIFDAKSIAFAQGNRIRKGTRPYYKILKWFSQNNIMTINLLYESKKRSLYSGGMKQVIDQDYILRLFTKHDFLCELFFYNCDTKELCIEDPKYLFYLRNMNWESFEMRAGFDELEESHSYDIAISFAGAQRAIAYAFFRNLSKDLSVFYDNDHQHEIFGENTDDFLEPIYKRDSRYVLALFSEDYPYKFWPRVEYESYKCRFPNREILPVYIGNAPSDPTSTEIGFEVISNNILNSKSKLKNRIEEICKIIVQKFQ